MSIMNAKMMSRSKDRFVDEQVHVYTLDGRIDVPWSLSNAYYPVVVDRWLLHVCRLRTSHDT